MREHVVARRVDGRAEVLRNGSCERTVHSLHVPQVFASKSARHVRGENQDVVVWRKRGVSHLRAVVLVAVDQAQRHGRAVAVALLLGEENVARQVGAVHVHATGEVDGLPFAVKAGTALVVRRADGVAERLWLAPTALFVEVAVEQVHVRLTRDGIFVRSRGRLTRRGKHQFVLVLSCERGTKVVGRRVQQHHGLHDVAALWLFDHDGCEVCLFNAVLCDVGISPGASVTGVHLNGFVVGFLIAQGVAVHEEHHVVAVSVLQTNGLVVPLGRHGWLVVQTVRLARLKRAVRFQLDVGLDLGVKRHVFAGGFVVTTALERLVRFEGQVTLGEGSRGCDQEKQEGGTQAGHGCLQVGRHSKLGLVNQGVKVTKKGAPLRRRLFHFSNSRW